MRIGKIYLFFIITACLIIGCAKPYTPKQITTATKYLVVEGVINTSVNDSTLIMLSRTVPLYSGVGTTPELQATIIIQSDNNQSYNLRELGKGIYTSDKLTLDNTHKYRLSINTSDGKNYVSDYIVPVNTPPIDSVGFIIKSDGLHIYANTHNSSNGSRYYRWDYNETWIFNSKYFSSFVSNGADEVQRTPEQYVYQCWGNDISTDIILGSSVNLTQDVIYQQPIAFIGPTSEKLETRYSILVKQYSLDKNGYSYFDELRKNTQELGGIFDPQPSQLTGNVHCTTNAAIPAIGYITAGTIQQKRIFIDNKQLPTNWNAAYPYDCSTDTAYYVNPKTGYNDVLNYLLSPGSTLLAITPIYAPGPPPPYPKPIAYVYSSAGCVDCTLRGTVVQPSFWK